MIPRITITRKRRKKMIFTSATAFLLCGIIAAGGIQVHSHYLSVQSSDTKMAEDMKKPAPGKNEKLPANTKTKQANPMIKIVQVEKEKVDATIENRAENDAPNADLLPDISYSKKAQLEDTVDLLSDLTD